MEEIKNQLILNLKKIVKEKKISHAYLFYGEEGVSKKTTAKFFARLIFCKKGLNCLNSCLSCKKINSNAHPDFLQIGGEGFLNSFNIETVRNLIKLAYVKPNESEFKIFLLKNVDFILPFAANALLKILENPPENVIFLLTAKNKNSVLKTIVSRCVCFYVAPKTKEFCYSFLKDLNLKLSEDFLKEIVNLSQGSIGLLKFYLTEQGGLILNYSKNLVNAYFLKDELKFNSILQKQEQNLENLVAIMECFLKRILVLLEQNNEFILKDVEKTYKNLELFENFMLNLKKGANKGLAIAKLCCEVF